MKKYLLHIGAVFLMTLCTLPALAHLNGSGYYRIRNAETGKYLIISNDKFSCDSCIRIGGGATAASKDPTKSIALATEFLRSDIKLVDDSKNTTPGAIIYSKARNYYPNEYNLIGQGTSILTLTTGSYYGDVVTVRFKDIYAHINSYGSADTISINLEGEGSFLFMTQKASLGYYRLVDDNGKLDISKSSNPVDNNAKWYIESINRLNVEPDVEFNGKYYTTMYVHYPFKLGNGMKAYYITGIANDGTLSYETYSSGSTVPAGTPVILECSSAEATNNILELTSTAPEFTTIDQSARTAPAAQQPINPSTNKLKGTYYSNTDGDVAVYSYTLHLNKIVSSANPQKYVLDLNSSSMLGFVEATTENTNNGNMPANKAWLEQAGNFAIIRTVATPVISPAAGTYSEAQTVTITAEQGATIEYSTDGGSTWQTYTGAFTVDETTTVQARAIIPGLQPNSTGFYAPSEVVSATYTIQESNPTLTANPTSLTINENGGSFTVKGSDLGTDNAGVTRTNGAFIPSLTASTGTATNGDANWYFTPSNGSLNGTVNVTYQGRELVDQTTFNVANNVASAEPVTVTYRPDIYLYGDFGNGWTYGDQMQYNNGVYTAQVNATTTTFLLFARKAGETYNPWNDNRYFFGPKTDGNNWLYVQDKTDDLDVNANVGGQYHPFELPEGKYTITINAADKTFTITRTIETVATPTLTPAAGTYTSIQNVTIACDTQGAVIHYTTDGSEPTANSPVYNGAIEVAQNTTIKAIALKDGWNPSQVATAEYVINLPQLAAPTFNPAAGTYTEAQSVEISAEQGATIRYKIDNGDYQDYTGPISVTGNCTITAYATKTGYTDSEEASATYTIKYPVATPTFNPAAGTYNGTQNVTISCDTQDATIYYKIDDGEYQIYEDPIEVSESCTITAKATKDGWTDSSEASAEYVINHPTLTIAPESLNINDEGGKFTVNGTYVDSNINIGFANNTDWHLNPETLSNTGGEVNVTYTGRALRAQNTVNAQAANNSSLTASGSVNYKSDIYIVTDNGTTGNWIFNNGTQMTDNEGIYTTTFTAPADNTFILFARMLGDGVNWNTRYVFGPDSNGDWAMPDDKVTENGNIDLYDDDPIKLPYAGDYMITIDATNPDHPTFTISRVLAESTLAEIESSGIVGKAYTVSDELIGVWAVNFDNTKLLWAKDQGNVSIDKRPAKTDDQTDYMVTHMKYQHYPWDGYDWDESNWAILDFSALDENPESFVGHKLTERSVSGIYRDANDYTIKLSEAPDMANGSENTFDANDYPGYAGVHSESNYGTKYAWAYNTYIPANFNEDNLNRLVDGVIVGAQSGPNALDNMQDQQLYFMNPKFMEIAHIWGIWEDNGANGRFVMIEPSFANNQTVNAWDLHGAVDVINWNYNRKDQNNYGQPHQLTEGAHDFHALIVRKSTGNKLTSDPSSGIYGIMPLDLPENGHPTAVKELIGNRVIKSISYYNVMGMESSRPFKGINIVVTRYSDGSSTTTKVLH